MEICVYPHIVYVHAHIIFAQSNSKFIRKIILRIDTFTDAMHIQIFVYT